MAKVKAKENKKSDVFQEKMDQIIQYMMENRKRIYLMSGVVLALILTVAGWMIYQMDYEKKAQKSYALAFNYSHFAPPSADAVFQALQLYRSVMEKYPGSRSAAYAMFSTGNILYRMSDFEGAIRAYDDFLRQTGAKNEWRSMAYNGLGYCYEAKGESDRALDAYEKATRDTVQGAYLASIYGNIARIYGDKNDSEKALSYYKKALEQKNEPLMEAMIKRKIAELET